MHGSKERSLAAGREPLLSDAIQQHRAVAVGGGSSSSSSSSSFSRRPKGVVQQVPNYLPPDSNNQGLGDPESSSSRDAHKRGLRHGSERISRLQEQHMLFGGARYHDNHSTRMVEDDPNHTFFDEEDGSDTYHSEADDELLASNEGVSEVNLNQGMNNSGYEDHHNRSTRGGLATSSTGRQCGTTASNQQQSEREASRLGEAEYQSTLHKQEKRTWKSLFCGRQTKAAHQDNKRHRLSGRIGAGGGHKLHLSHDLNGELRRERDLPDRTGNMTSLSALNSDDLDDNDHVNNFENVSAKSRRDHQLQKDGTSGHNMPGEGQQEQGGRDSGGAIVSAMPLVPKAGASGTSIAGKDPRSSKNRARSRIPTIKQKKYFFSCRSVLRLTCFCLYHAIDYWSNILLTLLCFFWHYITGEVMWAFSGICGCVCVIAAGSFSCYLALGDKYFMRFGFYTRLFLCVFPLGFGQGMIYKLAYHRYIRRKHVTGDYAASCEGSPYEVVNSSAPGWRFHTKSFVGLYESTFYAGLAAFMITHDLTGVSLLLSSASSIYSREPSGTLPPQEPEEKKFLVPDTKNFVADGPAGGLQPGTHNQFNTAGNMNHVGARPGPASHSGLHGNLVHAASAGVGNAVSTSSTPMDTSPPLHQPPPLFVMWSMLPSWFFIECVVMYGAFLSSAWTLAHVAVEIDYRVSAYIKERTDHSRWFSTCCIAGRVIEVVSTVMTLGFVVRIISLMVGNAAAICSFLFVTSYYLVGVAQLWIASPQEKSFLVHFFVGFMYMSADLSRFVDHPGFARVARLLSWRIQLVRLAVFVLLLLSGLVPVVTDSESGETLCFFQLMIARHFALFVFYATMVSGHLVFHLVQGYFVSPERDDIFLLAAAGDVARLKSVLTELSKLTVDVNHRRENGHAPLHVAARYNTIECINVLLVYGKANINLPTSRGKTALHIAAEEGKLATVRFLVECNATLNSQDCEGNTPLHLAAAKHYHEVVKYLIGTAGVTTDILNYEGALWYDLIDVVDSQDIDGMRHMMIHSATMVPGVRGNSSSASYSSSTTGRGTVNVARNAGSCASSRGHLQAFSQSVSQTQLKRSIVDASGITLYSTRETQSRESDLSFCNATDGRRWTSDGYEVDMNFPPPGASLSRATTGGAPSNPGSLLELSEMTMPSTSSGLNYSTRQRSGVGGPPGGGSSSSSSNPPNYNMAVEKNKRYSAVVRQSVRTASGTSLGSVPEEPGRGQGHLSEDNLENRVGDRENQDPKQQRRLLLSCSNGKKRGKSMGTTLPRIRSQETELYSMDGGETSPDDSSSKFKQETTLVKDHPGEDQLQGSRSGREDGLLDKSTPPKGTQEVRWSNSGGSARLKNRGGCSGRSPECSRKSAVSPDSVDAVSSAKFGSGKKNGRLSKNLASSSPEAASGPPESLDLHADSNAGSTVVAVGSASFGATGYASPGGDADSTMPCAAGKPLVCGGITAARVNNGSSTSTPHKMPIPKLGQGLHLSRTLSGNQMHAGNRMNLGNGSANECWRGDLRSGSPTRPAVSSGSHRDNPGTSGSTSGALALGSGGRSLRPSLMPASSDGTNSQPWELANLSDLELYNAMHSGHQPYNTMLQQQHSRTYTETEEPGRTISERLVRVEPAAQDPFFERGTFGKPRLLYNTGAGNHSGEHGVDDAADLRDLENAPARQDFYFFYPYYSVDPARDNMAGHVLRPCGLSSLIFSTATPYIFGRFFLRTVDEERRVLDPEYNAKREAGKRAIRAYRGEGSTFAEDQPGYGNQQYLELQQRQSASSAGRGGHACTSLFSNGAANRGFGKEMPGPHDRRSSLLAPSSRASSGLAADQRHSMRSSVRGSTLLHHQRLARRPPKRRDPLQNLDWNKLGPQDFTVLQQLGRGTFGTVMKVCLKDDPDVILALKLLSKKQYKVQNIVCRYYAEEHVLRTVKHPFIVLLYATFSTPLHWMLLMEFCPGGDLHDLLVSQGTPGLSQIVVLKAATEILLALEFLHARGIVFRDLKCENVILSASRTCRLTDFGLAKEDLDAARTDGVYSFCGSYGYCAPEVLQLKQAKKQAAMEGRRSGGGLGGKPKARGYGHAVDVYSFGVVLFMLVTGGQRTWSKTGNNKRENNNYKNKSVGNQANQAAANAVGEASRNPMKDQFAVNPGDANAGVQHAGAKGDNYQSSRNVNRGDQLPVSNQHGNNNNQKTSDQTGKENSRGTSSTAGSSKGQENRFPPACHEDLRSELDSVLRWKQRDAVSFRLPQNRQQYVSMREKSQRWQQHPYLLELVGVMVNESADKRGTCETMRGHQYFLHVDFSAALNNSNRHFRDVQRRLDEMAIAKPPANNTSTSSCASLPKASSLAAAPLTRPLTSGGGEKLDALVGSPTTGAVGRSEEDTDGEKHDQITENARGEDAENGNEWVAASSSQKGDKNENLAGQHPEEPPHRRTSTATNFDSGTAARVTVLSTEASTRIETPDGDGFLRVSSTANSGSAQVISGRSTALLSSRRASTTTTGTTNVLALCSSSGRRATITQERQSSSSSSSCTSRRDDKTGGEESIKCVVREEVDDVVISEADGEGGDEELGRTKLDEVNAGAEASAKLSRESKIKFKETDDTCTVLEEGDTTEEIAETTDTYRSLTKQDFLRVSSVTWSSRIKARATASTRIGSPFSSDGSSVQGSPLSDDIGRLTCVQEKPMTPVTEATEDGSSEAHGGEQ
ncbi:unnamed protein product [Amoebophrya sp. A25]|nr:unnamed protein product [Amoebophrya sp. A25]|eukprot:GSA25T00000038001.1